MAVKQLGGAESNSNDAATKGYVDAQLQAADGSGLTNSGNVLSVGAGTGISVAADSVSVDADYRSIAIPFFLTGSATTGFKLPEFIAPVAMSVVACYARANSGSGTALRPSKNGSAAGTILPSIGTTVVNNSQSVTLAAGDRLGVDVTTAGTGSDISVTFWANVT
jgi:hypothetical protein